MWSIGSMSEQAAAHVVLVCGDVSQGDGRAILELLGENPVVSYTDPPYNQAHATRFRRVAGIEYGKPDFWPLIEDLIKVCQLSRDSAFIEMGRKNADELVRRLLGSGAVVESWPITYDKKQPSTLHRATWSAQGRKFIDASTFEDLDDSVTPCHAFNRYSEPGDLVADWMFGRGLSARAAIETGRRFVGVELSPRRVAVAVSKSAKLLKTGARRITNLYEED